MIRRLVVVAAMVAVGLSAPVVVAAFGHSGQSESIPTTPRHDPDPPDPVPTPPVGPGCPTCWL